MSRVVDKQRILDDHEKERFRLSLRALEGFSGCRVLTYSILENHFHVLLHVPERQEVSDEEFLARVACLYPSQQVKSLATCLESLRVGGQAEAAEALKRRYTVRMYDLSQFMKTLKQRFTQGYNRRHGRKGTLWEERFKSVLVEGQGRSLATVAAYIDLNAVRAHLAADPKDYRFCGYGEAVSGAAPA